MSGRACAWCRLELPATARKDARTCGRKCRQALHRVRRAGLELERAKHAKRVAYADPPYPGRAWRFYRSAEVDHAELLRELEGFDGWALSTSADALAEVLPLCPAGVRVCAWVKPIGAAPKTRGLHNCWEPLIVKPARALRPGRRDWLEAQPARGNGKLAGRKPLAFALWLFGVLGLQAGDELTELFPGTAIVSRVWASLTPAADTSPTAAGDTSAEALGDGSQLGLFAQSLSGAVRLAELPPCELCDKRAIIVIREGPRCARHVSANASPTIAQAGELAASRKRRAAP